MKYNSSLRTVANTGHSDFHKMIVIYKTAYLLIAIKKKTLKLEMTQELIILLPWRHKLFIY